jgi:hypothetical protein
MTISANRFLTLEEMTINAEYIMSYLVGRNWSKNAVSGLLGNLQTESSINPGIWQGLKSYDDRPFDTVPGQGYGLVQWTPFNKYTIWASERMMDYKEMDSQLARIEYEVENNLQWFGGYSSQMSFAEFTRSTESPEFLAEVFIKTYEHPADPDQPARGTQARYWYETLTGIIEIPPDEVDLTKNDIFHLWLSDALRWG